MRSMRRSAAASGDARAGRPGFTVGLILLQLRERAYDGLRLAGLEE